MKCAICKQDKKPFYENEEYCLCEECVAALPQDPLFAITREDILVACVDDLATEKQFDEAFKNIDEVYHVIQDIDYTPYSDMIKRLIEENM